MARIRSGWFLTFFAFLNGFLPYSANANGSHVGVDVRVNTFRPICPIGFVGPQCVAPVRKSARFVGRAAFRAGRFAGRVAVGAGRLVGRAAFRTARFAGRVAVGAARAVGRAGRFVGRAAVGVGRFLFGRRFHH